MGNLVIVAIPEEQDRVWKISSEKVPHLTLLFLGDEANVDSQQVVQFVEHAVTLSEHGEFYLDVDRRGELGDDKADVVFFSKRSWNLRWIKQFRAQLLQHPAIKTAYDSTEQFPEWTPHLTLGYPETPANKLDDPYDDTLYSVRFDRIAVWTGDYKGPEFQLEWPDRELEGDLAIAYSDTQKMALMHGGKLGPRPETAAERGAEFLEHYGVLGMKWGVRRPPMAVAPKAVSKVPHGARRKTKIESEGGENHPAHDDAIKVAKSQAKLKKSGTKALSNQELRDLAERIRLEEQATQMTRSAGSKWVRRFLGNQGNQVANQVVRTEIDSRVRNARSN